MLLPRRYFGLGLIVGLVAWDMVASAAARRDGAITRAQIAGQDYMTISEATHMDYVIAVTRSHQVSTAVVFSEGRAGSTDQVVGLITEDQIVDMVVEDSGLD